MADRRLKIAKFPILALATFAGFSFGFASALAQQPGFIPAEQSPAPRSIQCSAALELMARAAPRWSAQPVAQEARYFWRGEAQRLAQAAGRDTNTEIGQEMGLLAEQAVSNPDALSNRATLCISDVPSPASQPPQIIQQSTQPPLQQQNQYQQAAPVQPVAQPTTQPQQDKQKRRRFGLFRR